MSRLVSNPTLLGTLAVLNVPLYLGLGRIAFRDWEGVREALRYWITPDWWSWISGRGFDDAWAELKIVWYLVVCASLVASEYVALLRWFPG